MQVACLGCLCKERGSTQRLRPKGWVQVDAFVIKLEAPMSSYGWVPNAKFFDSFEDHIVVEAMEFPMNLGNLKSGDEIEVRVTCESSLGLEKSGIQVKKCGIHLVDEPNVKDEAYTSDFDISTDDKV
jgi:hypothetical protein